jgi:hypothetical protein
MATNLDIIKRAMKKIHVLASGTEPTSAQAADGMAALQSLIVELIGQGSLGRLYDVLATSDLTAYEGMRVHASAGVVVTLPTIITGPPPSSWPYAGDVPGAGCGWDYGFGGLYSGYPRPPRDRAVIVVITNGVPVYNVWRTYTNAWVVINSLTQQGAFPFADYLEDGFAAMLAERIAEDYDQEIGPQTIRQAGICRTTLSAKRDSVSAPTQASYF